MNLAAATSKRTFICRKKSQYGSSGHIRQQNGQRFESSDTDLNVAAATQQRSYISHKNSKQRSSGLIHQQNRKYVKKSWDNPFFGTDNESSKDGDAESTVRINDTMADRQMPPHNAEPRSGNHQERVTNIIDLYSSTDTSSTVSPTISEQNGI